MMSEKTQERLKALRRSMKKHQLDAFILPVNDPHFGEHVQAHWRALQWISGFSGSSGSLVVTSEYAGLWTDARYFVQAEEELRNCEIRLEKLRTADDPAYVQKLVEILPSGARVGFDGRLISMEVLRTMAAIFQPHRIRWESDIDLISDIWTEKRPPLPGKAVWEHRLRYAGETRRNKLARIRKRMREMKVDFQLLSAPDDIAWTLNIRGMDMPYSPLFRAYAVIMEEDFYLFADKERFPLELRRLLEQEGVEFMAYQRVYGLLEGLDENKCILFSPETTSAAIYESLQHVRTKREDVSIPGRMKAVKNEKQQTHLREVMVRDGLALTNFFYWLEQEIGEHEISELSASKKLLEFRKEQEHFLMPSFETISACNEHAALPHYSPTLESDAPLRPQGIYMVDSGGQYLDGTTDVTRTIALGKPTDRQRMDFTLALKGMLQLSIVRFPAGTRGYQLDVLARKALWDEGLEYGHGTGHGVGFCLNVHEGPQYIGCKASESRKAALEAGMVCSNEPAVYREGKWGFRTENLLLCKEAGETEFGQFLEFETLTLACIDTRLIDTRILTTEEREWINRYHQEVYKKLSPRLDARVTEWLQKKCKAI